MKPRVNAVFIPSGDDDTTQRPWCERCKKQYHYFDEPKTWSCSGCGSVLNRNRTRKAKAVDSDTPNPLVATSKRKKKEARKQDYPDTPTIMITEEKEYNPVSEEWNDII